MYLRIQIIMAILAILCQTSGRITPNFTPLQMPVVCTTWPCCAASQYAMPADGGN